MKLKESPQARQGPRPEVVVAVITAVSGILIALITVLPNLLDRWKLTPTPAVAAVTVMASASPSAAQLDVLVASPAAPTHPATTEAAASIPPPTSAPIAARQSPTIAPATSPAGTAAPTVAAGPPITAANVSRLVETRAVKPFGSAVGVAVSPDATLLFVNTSFKGEVYDFHALGKPLYDFAADEMTMGTGLALTRDGRLAAVGAGSEDNTAVIVNVADGGFVLHALKGHTARVEALAFSPDGAILATGGSDNSLRLWDVATGGQIKRQVVGDRGVLSVEFSPDGGRLVSGGGDGQVHVWDRAGEPVTAFAYGELDIVDFDFNPAGTLIAAAAQYDAAISLFETGTWKAVKVLRGHELNGGIGVTCVAFSPDRNLLASGGGDRTIRIWDVAPSSPSYGRSLVTLLGHSDWPNSLLFTADGSALVSGSDRDGTVRVWEVGE